MHGGSCGSYQGNQWVSQFDQKVIGNPADPSNLTNGRLYWGWEKPNQKAERDPNASIYWKYDEVLPPMYDFSE